MPGPVGLPGPAVGPERPLELLPPMVELKAGGVGTTGADELPGGFAEVAAPPPAPEVAPGVGPPVAVAVPPLPPELPLPAWKYV
jgi:hypothetical protein